MLSKYLIAAYILTFTLPCFAQTDGVVERFELKKISVKGNKLFSDNEIRNMLGLEKGTLYERYLFDFYLEGGLDTIKRRYSLEGYEYAKVRWVFKDVKEDSRKMQIEVEEGERKKITDVVIRGVEIGDNDDIIKKLTVKQGEPLAEGLVAKGSDDIASYCLNRGFADVNVEYEISREDATVVYNVEEGRRFRIDKVVISGNVRTRGKIIQREIKLKRGDLYNQELVDASRKNIYDTKLYRRVRIEPHPSEEFGDMKTLSVLVEEDKPRWLEINPGFSSPDRIRIAGKWGHNNFLFNNNNRLTFEGDISYGFSDKRFRGESSLTYVEPWLFGYRYRGELELSTERSIYSDFHFWQVAVEPRISKELGRYVEVGGGFEYSTVNFTYGPQFLKEIGGKLDEGVDAGNKTEEESKDYISTLGGDYDIFTGKLYQRYDSTNDDWNPINGIYGYSSEELMGGPFPGDVNAYRFIGDIRKFIPITGKATMGVHIRSGFVHEFGSTEEVPFAERFFTGGAFSVRGYGEQQLGPKSPSGDPLGARILGLSNAEFRFQLPFVDGVLVPGIKLDLSPFWGGLFFDAGNVWNSVKEIQKESLRYGAGLGLRYNTPVGPLRLDYGREIALDGSPGKYGVFYIAFGNAF